MQRFLSNRPMGKGTQCLAHFLLETWAAERLSGQLSKLHPNQAECHLSIISSTSCQALKKSTGMLVERKQSHYLQ